jgi:hypothetical protein
MVTDVTGLMKFPETALEVGEIASPPRATANLGVKTIPTGGRCSEDGRKKEKEEANPSLLLRNPAASLGKKIWSEP